MPIPPARTTGIPSLASPRNCPAVSRLGGLFVNRESSLSGDYNRRTRWTVAMGIGDQFTLTSFLARTETPGLEGADHAWNTTAGWSSL